MTVCLSIRMANVTGSIWPASSTFGLPPYLCPASTMLLPYCYHASTGVYLLGNQWCSPWSLVSDLTSSGFSSSPIGVPVPLFFQCRRGDQHMKGRIEKHSPCPLSYVVLFFILPGLLPKQIISVAYIVSFLSAHTQ